MNKTRKNYKKTKLGGKVLASGGYGCVFKPALKCQDSNKRKTNSVSKLMTDRHVMQEYEEIKLLNTLLKDIHHYQKYFLVYNASVCKPAKLTKSDLDSYASKCTALPKNNITNENINKKLDELMILNLPDGGVPVDDFLYDNGGYEELYDLEIHLIQLFKKGIIPMNERNVYHCDIKDSNILVDKTDRQTFTRLIDWGLSTQYTPGNDSPFPSSWRNRPLQFNTPFSVIIFTDDFYSKYTEYLKDGGKPTEDELKPFVLDYLKYWMDKRGIGHYRFINDIMFLIYSNTLTSIPEKDKAAIIETQFTVPAITEYVIDVLVHYTKFRDDGTLNLRDYLDEVYIKIVDVWGFISVHYPILEMLGNNYKSLDAVEMRIFKQLQFIFTNYMYNPRHEPIDNNALLKSLKMLADLIYYKLKGKKKTVTSSKSSGLNIASGLKTRKRSQHETTIFTRKPKKLRFRRPLFVK